MLDYKNMFNDYISIIKKKKQIINILFLNLVNKVDIISNPLL